MNQIFIFISGAFCIGLTQQPWFPALEKYAPVIGLLSQPFWLYETYTAGQHGMFFNSCLITVVWMIGIHKYWLSSTHRY